MEEEEAAYREEEEQRGAEIRRDDSGRPTMPWGRERNEGEVLQLLLTFRP